MNDNQFSIAGNIVREPVFNTVAGGKSVVNFRIASTPRRFDQQANEWRNGEPVYLTVNCWHRLAERVKESLQAGDPVIVTGRLRMRSYEHQGERRTVYEIDAQHVAPDLNRVSVTLLRVPRRSEEPVTSAPVAPMALESEVAA